jgi:pyridoxal phosphate enzyme (YggS family)
MKENIAVIRNMIQAAKVRSGRTEDSIKLIAVTKTQSVDVIRQAYENGLFIFGENRVQELVDKYPFFEKAEWHLIGHLQRNKVKYIIDKVKMIHSVDSLELAREIDIRAKAINKVMPVLLQINIGREATKSGIFEENLEAMLECLSKMNNLTVAGLMTVPPIGPKEQTREYFKRMYKHFLWMKEIQHDNFNVEFLSMGMTDDFEIAIEEGANIIRIGTGLFGKRVYNTEGV